MSARLINLVLRMASLFSRFLLAILLAKSMNVEDFAFYSLFAATVAYLVYVVGIDFYTYNVRDLVTRPMSSWYALLRDQLLLYSVTFALVSGCCLVLWAIGRITGYTLVWLLLLLVTEHLAQELNRLLIMAGMVLQSSIALFIRSGFWVLLLALLCWGSPDGPLTLQKVFTLWLGGCVLAIVWSQWCLRQVLYDRRSANMPVDWERLRTGIKVAASFLAGTLVLKFVSTADRFLVEHFAGLVAVGPYVLYVGLAGAIAALVDAAVVVYDYPGLIRAWQAGDERNFYALYYSFLRRVFLHALGAALLLALILRPLIDFIGKHHILEAWPLAVPLILANVVLALANVPHYSLYAARKDREILVATITGSVAFLLAAVMIGPWFGALSVAWSFFFSTLVVLALKILAWRRVRKQKIWTSIVQKTENTHLHNTH